MIDSYIGGELLVETNHEVLHHLENCSGCRREIAARRELRVRLRSAIKNSPDAQMNLAFAARLQANLREASLRPTWLEKLGLSKVFANPQLFAGALAACLVLITLSGLLGARYLPSSEQIAAVENSSATATATAAQPVESPMLQALAAAWREIKETAVGDHENCALEFRLAEKPISLDEAAKKYRTYNKNLDKAVTASVKKAFPKTANGEIELLDAHSCLYAGKRFAHIVLRYQNRTISVLVTDTDLPAAEMDAETDSETIAGMHAVGFRAAHHAVFVVSDLPEKDITAVAQAVLPAVRIHIEGAGV